MLEKLLYGTDSSLLSPLERKSASVAVVVLKGEGGRVSSLWCLEVVRVGAGTRSVGGDVALAKFDRKGDGMSAAEAGAIVCVDGGWEGAPRGGVRSVSAADSASIRLKAPTAESWMGLGRGDGRWCIVVSSPSLRRGGGGVGLGGGGGGRLLDGELVPDSDVCRALWAKASVCLRVASDMERQSLKAPGPDDAKELRSIKVTGYNQSPEQGTFIDWLHAQRASALAEIQDLRSRPSALIDSTLNPPEPLPGVAPVSPCVVTHAWLCGGPAGGGVTASGSFQGGVHAGEGGWEGGRGCGG